MPTAAKSSLGRGRRLIATLPASGAPEPSVSRINSSAACVLATKVESATSSNTQPSGTVMVRFEAMPTKPSSSRAGVSSMTVEADEPVPMPTSSTASISFQLLVMLWSRLMATVSTVKSTLSTSTVNTPGHGVLSNGSALSGRMADSPVLELLTSTLTIAPGLYV